MNTNNSPKLARKLGPFSAAMIVMGGIIGAGIFKNPYVVANRVHTTPLILGCWLLGGAVAMAGAFVYAELAARRPQLVGGQYAYLRDAYHPIVGFLYGWALLLVIQTGGMAAVSIIFAQYFLELTHLHFSSAIVAVITLLLLTIVNCLGVKAGAAVQNVLMVIKILAIVGLIACALIFVGMPQFSLTPAFDRPASIALVAVLAAGMSPVLFAYGGWHTASFVAAEMRDPKKDLARGILVGVIGVVLLYLAVNIVCVGALGAKGLSEASAPASSVMRLALGERGARLIAVAIAISTLGFLSQSMLTAPRVYFAMADDKLFFKQVARIGRRTKAPVVAIVLQGVLAAAIALFRKFDQIVDYVVSVDFIAYGLTAACLFVFRRRDHDASSSGYLVPGHPVTTLFFIAVCWSVVAGTVFSYPMNTVIGLGIVLAGVPAYFFWQWWRREG
jgi:basic amino acid/polyamine antiporter, APA family